MWLSGYIFYELIYNLINRNYLYLIFLLRLNKIYDVSDFGSQLIIYYLYFFLILLKILLLYFFNICKCITTTPILLSCLAIMILEFFLLSYKRFTNFTRQFYKVVLLYYLLKLKNYWQISLYQLK